MDRRQRREAVVRRERERRQPTRPVLERLDTITARRAARRGGIAEAQPDSPAPGRGADEEPGRA